MTAEDADRALEDYVKAKKFTDELLQDQKRLTGRLWEKYIIAANAFDEKNLNTTLAKYGLTETQINCFYTNLRRFIDSRLRLTLQILKENR